MLCLRVFIKNAFKENYFIFEYLKKNFISIFYDVLFIKKNKIKLEQSCIKWLCEIILFSSKCNFQE